MSDQGSIKDKPRVILHFGLGAFHRAHQAVFTHEANRFGQPWTIEAVAMRNGAPAHALNDQQGRYTLVVTAPEGERLSKITSISRAYVLPDQPQEILSRFGDPAVQIVTVTVTEKGYYATPARELDFDADAIRRDLTNLDKPLTLVGALVAGLRLRHDAGGRGMTLISCDNLTENGDLLKTLVLAFAGRVEPDLREWIEVHCTFPNTMVDRITPAATPEFLDQVERALGHADPLAIATEPFSQWVIEDRFAGERPVWEKSGVLFVDDVAPFELAKLRLLNGAHSLIAYLGCVAGLPAVRDVMADEPLARFVRHHMACAALSLPETDGLNISQYIDDLIARFSNPAIDHRCIQIAMDGSQKLPQRIFQPAHALFHAGHPVETCAVAIAAWIVFLIGRDENEQSLPINDPMAEALQTCTLSHLHDLPLMLQTLARLDGLQHHGMLDEADFVRSVIENIERLQSEGVHQTIRNHHAVNVG